MLTVECISDGPEVAICFDDAGIALLIEKLLKLQAAGRDGHDHMFTPSWAGDGLAETPLGVDTTLINSVRLVYRAAPWSGPGANPKKGKP